VTIWRLSGEHFEGASARLKGKTIVFVMCDPDTGGIALPAQPARNAEYYVAGLAAGNYTVTAEDRIIGRETVTADKPLMVLNAGAGEMAISRSR
jgi:hypothetical protein